MLRNRSGKGISMSCLHLQKEITKSYPSQSIAKRSKSQFIPFTS